MIWRMCDLFKHVYLFNFRSVHQLIRLLKRIEFQKNVATCFGNNVILVKKGSEEDV